MRGVREGIVWTERSKGGGGGGGVVGCSIHSVSLAEAGRYRYSLQGDDWPERVRVASSGARYKEESLSL